MDVSTPEHSIPFSSLNSPSSANEDIDIDIDTDGIFVESNFLVRNTDGGGDDGEESLRPQNFLHTSPQQKGSRRYMLRCLVASLLITCIIFVIIDSAKIESILKTFLEWSHDHPYRGIIAVIMCYIIATIFFVPGSILTIGAGYAIGSVVDNVYLGTILATFSVFIGASIGSICSFLLGRYLFRDCVLQLASSYPIFQAIERALETNGLKIMVLLRLSPLIPFNALDYISGITSISLRDYAIALVAILPGALVLCFAGASASSLSDITSSPDSNTFTRIIIILSGILFGGFGVYLGSHYSKIELDRILATQDEHSSTESITGVLSQEENEIIIEVDHNGENNYCDNNDQMGFGTELV